MIPTLGEIYAKARSYHQEAPTQQALPTPVASEPAQVVEPLGALLDNVNAKTENLIRQMQQRKAYWERQIRDATEELRQTEVVLEGAIRMLSIVQGGLPKVADATAAPTEDEFETFMGELAERLVGRE